LKVTEFWSLW